jgi:hypothetical protein
MDPRPLRRVATSALALVASLALSAGASACADAASGAAAAASRPTDSSGAPTEPLSPVHPPPSPPPAATAWPSPPTSRPSPAISNPSAPSRETRTPPIWVVGSETLPVRSDGFGEIRPTPEALVDRRLPTSSRLPPPASDAYEASVSELGPQVLDRMGDTWHPGCPVGPHDLRYLTVSFWGFDGGHHTGELVVHRDATGDIIEVFRRLHAARFPIEEMRLITTADLLAPPTGDGNNTAAFICRPIRGGTSWSAHASGLAVDINPFHNPYRRAAVVLPERASAYLDRTWARPGMIAAEDVVTSAFAAVGWKWGGNWSSPDPMHFSATGR